MLTDRGDIVIWRQKYIEDIRKYRSEGCTIYYLDETWVNAFLQGLSTGPKNPIGKGKRLIVVHIGSSEGFIVGGRGVSSRK